VSSRWKIGFWLLCGLLGCTQARTNLVSDPAASEAGVLDASHDVARPEPRVDASAQSDAATHQASARCGKRACACDDGLDNDADGLIDGLDPECTGSFDDDEASFGIGKSNKLSKCRDCFWDDNSGSGDDGCRYPQECLTGQMPPGNGNCSSCTVSQACVDSCRDRTPNGCDCFGCCEVVREQGDLVFVELSELCALDHLDDTQACPRCVQNTACANPCGRCELCLGRKASDLPADCHGTRADGTPNYACDDGQTVCVTSQSCPGASYCQLGCCLVDLL
jgi:hypothetical protein